jgi:hypothetical protein
LPWLSLCHNKQINCQNHRLISLHLNKIFIFHYLSTSG